MNKALYLGLVVAQLITFAAYAVVTAGAALLQKKANTLAIWNGLSGTDLAGLTDAYNEVFQSTQYIIPYPQRPKYQFQYQWWIIEFELFVFLLTALATLVPSLIPRIKPVALTFLASALVLVMDNINALFFLLRNDTAKTVFDAYRIKTAQAGLILVAIGNCLTIIFMGMYEREPYSHGADARADIDVKNGKTATAV